MNRGGVDGLQPPGSGKVIFGFYIFGGSSQQLKLKKNHFQNQNGMPSVERFL